MRLHCLLHWTLSFLYAVCWMEKIHLHRHPVFLATSVAIRVVIPVANHVAKRVGIPVVMCGGIPVGTRGEIRGEIRRKKHVTLAVIAVASGRHWQCLLCGVSGSAGAVTCRAT